MRKFQTKNEGFLCENCQREIFPRKRSCRNHCPFCLTSKHVDIHPGDRQHQCQGLMDCTGYELSPKKGVVLIFKCRNCGEQTRNIAALDDDDVQKDDYSLILSRSQTC